jgi:hypothetical protein
MAGMSRTDHTAPVAIRIYSAGFQKIRPHADAVGYGCAWRERIKTLSTGAAQAREVISNVRNEDTTIRQRRA